MRRIYCISGLGADHRVFSRIQIAGYELVAVPWLQSLEDDTLPTYAKRMFESIGEPDPIVLGLSFGGMLATEIKKQFGISNVIIVSSAKTRQELGYNNRVFSWLGNSKAISDSFFITPSRVVLYLLGAESEADQVLVRDMISSGSATLNRWVVNAILGWDNQVVPPGIVHIHGTNDLVIRSAHVVPTHWIQDGGHFMVYNRADQVSAIVTDILAKQHHSRKV